MYSQDNKRPFSRNHSSSRSSSPFQGGARGISYDTRRPPEKEMIFGIRAIIEAIDAGKTLDKILLRRDMTSTIGKELLKKLMGTTTPVQKVPVEKLNQYTDKNHQGAIAFLSPIDFCSLETLVPTLYEEGKTPLLMVLDGVTDVRLRPHTHMCVLWHQNCAHLSHHPAPSATVSYPLHTE